MFIPFDRPLDWRSPPVATLLLIMLNLCFFVVWQGNDDNRLSAALQFYADSGLAELETKAYTRYMSATAGRQATLRLEHELARPANDPAAVFTTLQSDATFLTELRANRVIRPDSPQFERWRATRSEFELLLDRVVSLGYGLVPSAPRLESLVLNMFLHASWAHLLGNMVFLFLFGYVVEVVLGRPLFLAAYLASGLIASLAYVALFSHSAIPTVGASGAVSGVVGMYTALFGLRRIRIFYWVLVYFDYVRVPAIALLPLWIGYELTMQLLDPSHVNRVAHITGLVAGAAIALVAKRFLPGVDHAYLDAQEQAERREQRHREGLDLVTQMDLDKARAVFEQLLQEQPDDRRALHQLYNVSRFNPSSKHYQAIAHRILALEQRDAATNKLVHDTYRDYIGQMGSQARFTTAELNGLAQRFAQGGFASDAQRIIEHLLKCAAPGPEIAATIMVVANACRRCGDDEGHRRWVDVLISRFPDSDQARSLLPPQPADEPELDSRSTVAR